MGIEEVWIVCAETQRRVGLGYNLWMIGKWETGDRRLRGCLKKRRTYTKKPYFGYCIAYIIRLGTIPLFFLQIP
ncbi:hypothetical protein NEUTE1DRAFT_117654 [Neurospora tetrasperma FGSC 2508]|uniref:Uncharacterized protein n=2 Tax=Neurospora TaxID=5140 RepID=A0AAJ0MLU1_9PEZI|nr:uncharacterized protein NEUTE1DRAFT_117654 [Neurospora tetrasperma FGSC 2508]EGO55080.1 hypothetical protein NEUTE1DRAFT_117654 [Neurospora tetrasperma FGSC 2508]EGZ69713.1 hypothetical protein NEUTE2DRAFT_145637 [Neurospora tetrasperma FGSC 2509]KAK3485282.1 hypothetical protein B0T23DRAFT_44720 [Neurospora hispaniola]